MQIDSYSVTRNVPVPMRDGVSLMTDLWLPASQRPSAVVLMRTPYDRTLMNSEFLRPQELAEAGFAAAVQDTRGRFASEGVWKPFMWEQEGLDGYDSIEWLAAQPWCSGAVGMAGVSYSGIIQLTAARLRPPHLRAIAPALAGTARHERAERGGAFWLDHLFGWLSFVATDWARRTTTVEEHERPALMRTVLGFLRDPATLLNHRPLRDAPLFALPGFPVSFDDIAERSVTPDVDPGDIDVPILSVGGWFDVYVRSTLGLFDDDGASPAARHLLVGPWTHSNMLPAIQGECHFGLAAYGAAAGVAATHLNFFRRYLRDEAVELPRARYFIMNAGRWESAAHWPPENAETHVFYLRSRDNTAGRGALRTTAAEGEETPHRYVYDPSDPTPTIGGRLMSINGLVPGPIDQSPLAGRPDVLCFDMPPLTEALALIGSACARLHISVDAANVDVIVKLIDVAADGRSYPITDGIVRLTGLEPGSGNAVSIVLADTAWLIRRGHALRVQIQSGNFPHIDPNMIVDGRAGQVEAGRPATITVHHDAQRPSSIAVGRGSGAR